MYIVTTVYGHCLSCVSCVCSCLPYVVHYSLVVAISCLYLWLMSCSLPIMCSLYIATYLAQYLSCIVHDVLLMFAVCCSVLAICY